MAAVPVGCRYTPFPLRNSTQQPQELATRRPAEVATSRAGCSQTGGTRSACEVPASYPFADDGATVPPVCLRSHWDPEQIIRRTLPAGPALATPLDPRPWTKVCMEYVTSQDFEDAPRPSDDKVFPSGGTVYPPTRYREAIEKESSLRRLDRNLGICEDDQYVPSLQSDLYRPGLTIPDRPPPSDRFISELAMPAALLRPAGSAGYACRAEQDSLACKLSPALFNNTTKQNRYWAPGHRPTLQQPPAMDPMPTSKVQLS